TQMRAEAHYYSGGGLDGAKIAWHATPAPATYRPVGFDGNKIAPRRTSNRDGDTRDASGRLGPGSASAIAIAIGSLPDNAPSLLEVDATVTDLDRAIIRA